VTIPNTTCTVCHNGVLAGNQSDASLTAAAVGIHGSAISAGFTVANNPLNLMRANVSASTNCATATNTLALNWGDGSSDTSGSVATHTYVTTHTYATAGEKVIKLTVTCGTASAQAAKVFTAVAPVVYPVAAANVSWDNDTWTVTLSNNTAGGNIAQVVAYWGDGSNTILKRPASTIPLLAAIDLGTANVTHTYKTKGISAYKVTLKVTDTAGNVVQTTNTDPVAFGYFTIAGTVATDSVGTTGVPSATVLLKNSLGKAVALTYTSSKAGQIGSFSFTKLTPGTYTMTVTKSGKTFTTDPDLTKIVGGNKTGFVIAPDGL
jgi:hypothetical protein